LKDGTKTSAKKKTKKRVAELKGQLGGGEW